MVTIAAKRHYHQKGILSFDDLRQEGFIGLLQAARSWKPELGKSLANFVWIRIHGQIRDAIRTASHRRSVDGEVVGHGTFAESFTPSHYADALTVSAIQSHEGECSARVDIHRAVAGLKERHQRFVELRFFRRLTHAQIAAELGVNESRSCQIERDVIRLLRLKFKPLTVSADSRQ